ncbi:MAG: hypothetical protein Q7S24_02270, partial [bacterium]|nr:hypothetical protein [bacterium]
VGDCSETACVGNPKQVGATCTTQSDCEDGGLGYCMGIGDTTISAAGVQSTAYSTGAAQLTDVVDDARNRLKFVVAGMKSGKFYLAEFARDSDDDGVNDTMNEDIYVESGLDYWSTTATDPSTNIFDNMQQCATDDGTRPLDSEGDESEYCGVLPTVSGITINGESSSTDGFYSITNGQTVTLEFTATVDGEQLPLNNIYIDWGDGTFQPSSPESYYHNYIGAQNLLCDTQTKKCDYSKAVTSAKDPGIVDEYDKEIKCDSSADCTFADSCLSKNDTNVFGQVLGLTCENSYFQYGHIYQCKEGNDYWQEGGNCPDTEMAKSNGGCCVYKPKVQVKDNWGWYNGVCKQSAENPTNVGGDGCYDKPKGNDEGGLSSGPYTCFGNNCEIGKGINVLVAPR